MKLNFKDLNLAPILITVLVSALLFVVVMKFTKYKSELTGDSFKAELALGSKKDVAETEED